MQLKHINSTIYSDGNVELKIITESMSPMYGGRVKCAVDTYCLEIGGETKRMDAGEFASLKNIMRAIMGVDD